MLDASSVGFQVDWHSSRNLAAGDLAVKFRPLCLPKTLSGMTRGWAYGNEAADGRVSDPAAACYPARFTRRARLSPPKGLSPSKLSARRSESSRVVCATAYANGVRSKPAG